MNAREHAEALERQAERTDDPDTWIVASDAWLEVGDGARAWYARLRSREPYGNSVGRLILREHAEAIALALAPSNNRVSNEARGALKLFEFMALQPKRVFAYYETQTSMYVGDAITSFMGDRLGTVVHRGRVTRPFGNEARIQHVRVRAINGYIYRGTCAIDNGTYCKLRRAEPWLRGNASDDPASPRWWPQ